MKKRRAKKTMLNGKKKIFLTSKKVEKIQDVIQKRRITPQYNEGNKTKKRDKGADAVFGGSEIAQERGVRLYFRKTLYREKGRTLLGETIIKLAKTAARLNK